MSYSKVLGFKTYLVVVVGQGEPWFNPLTACVHVGTAIALHIVVHMPLAACPGWEARGGVARQPGRQAGLGWRSVLLCARGRPLFCLTPQGAGRPWGFNACTLCVIGRGARKQTPCGEMWALAPGTTSSAVRVLGHSYCWPLSLSCRVCQWG